MSSFVPTDEENTRRKVDIRCTPGSDAIVPAAFEARARHGRACALDSIGPHRHMISKDLRAPAKRSVAGTIHGDSTPMKIHEYQAKAILRASRRAGAAGRSRLRRRRRGAASPTRLGGGTVVVKAQIHAGGRGKGGGVKVVKGPDEAGKAAADDDRACGSSPTRPARPGRSCSACSSSRGCRSSASCTSGIVHRPVDRAAGADGQPRRRRRDREGRRGDARADLQGVHPSRRRAERLPDAEAGVRARARGAAGRAGRQGDDGGLRRVHRDRRVAHRDQSAHRHRRRQPARARREDDVRRQRALPPPRLQGAARHRRRGSARGRSVEVLA